jgi:hypothetical protein
VKRPERLIGLILAELGMIAFNKRRREHRYRACRLYQYLISLIDNSASDITDGTQVESALPHAQGFNV